MTHALEQWTMDGGGEGLVLWLDAGGTDALTPFIASPCNAIDADLPCEIVDQLEVQLYQHDDYRRGRGPKPSQYVGEIQVAA